MIPPPLLAVIYDEGFISNAVAAHRSSERRWHEKGV
jgi:hypothetical protein